MSDSLDDSRMSFTRTIIISAIPNRITLSKTNHPIAYFHLKKDFRFMNRHNSYTNDYIGIHVHFTCKCIISERFSLHP